MGVLGELFPGRKILDEAGESGDAQPWRLGPIDLENNVVEIRRAAAAETPGTGPGDEQAAPLGGV